MGFFSLKAQCAICNKTVGLNRFQLSKNVWICPACKKEALSKIGGWTKFDDLMKMSVDEIKQLINNPNTIKIDAGEALQKSKDHRQLFLENAHRKFNDGLNSIPQIEIQLSDEKIKRRYLKNFEEVEFKKITKAKNIEKLLPFVVIDVETTGLSAGSCEIIEFSAIKYETDINTPTACMTTLLKSKKPIPDDVIKITHITDEMIDDKPYFYQIKDSINEFIKGCNIVGQNTLFDLKFLYVNGVDLDYNVKYYDTLQIAKSTLKGPKTKYSAWQGGYAPDYDSEYDVVDFKLDTLCEFFNIYRENSHRSLSDCYATAKLFSELIDYKKMQ